MGVKQRLHDIFFQNTITKKMYCKASYIKGKIYYGRELATPIKKYKAHNRKPVFLIFTPEHANLGDHAIAYAEQKMLNRLGITYYEITGKQLYTLHQYGYFKLLNNATVLVNGGGNLGMLWSEIEKMNRWIISELKDSTICIMPNSIYYAPGEDGQQEFRRSIEIYNRHPRLYMYARELTSYDIMKKAYKNVKLIPDVVLSLNECKNSKDQRKGCLFCMRDDVERTLSDEEYQILYQEAKKLFGEIGFSNTVLDYNVKPSDREKELKKKLIEYQQAELVVTDRLHGMIFCAITGTKCIVLNGKSPKIRGCYHWIEKLDYISFIENAADLNVVYASMPDYPHQYEMGDMQVMFQKLEKDIGHIVEFGTW